MRIAFSDNVIAIQAHLLAKAYGTLPTEVLQMTGSDFWMNADIHAAGEAWIQDQRDGLEDAHDGAGSATRQDKETLVDAQEARADARDGSVGQPPLDDQLSTLEVNDG